MGLTEYDGSLSAYGLEFKPESLHIGQGLKTEADWLEEMSCLICEEGGARLSCCCVQDRHRAIQVDANLKRTLHIHVHVIHVIRMTLY